jgi:solute:Na+ symporter, SSS family
VTGLDYTIVAAFLIAMALAGLGISRLIRDSDDFFVAGRELTPFILCATITATNLSMFHIIGMGGTAYQSGVSIIWQNWTGSIGMVISGILIVPIMRRLRIRSIPEFLEMRYSRSLRILIGGFWGLRLCAYLGILLYLAATAAVVITGWDNYLAWLLVFSVVAILYSAIGGAWAVAIMDSVQFVVMLLGILIVLPIVMYAAGGLPTLITWLKTHGQANHVRFVPVDGEFNWIFILAIMLLSIKFCTVDQAILQRAFGARNTRIGAKGMVFSALITMPLAFFWVLPGLAAARLYPGGSSPDHAIPWLFSTYLPTTAKGLLGVVLCGLVAAQVSTITADINSVATLLTSDVYRNLKRRPPTQRQLLFVVRISSLLCGVLMLWTAYKLNANTAGAVRANLAVVSIVDMPLFVITVIYGLLWKRANWQGALAGFVAGGTVGVLWYLLVSPDTFNGYFHPALEHVSQSLAALATSCHEHLRCFRSHILSLAVFVSAMATLLVTPIVSLLTPPSPERARSVWSAFEVDLLDDEDDFHVMPASRIGRIGLALVVIGFFAFLAGVLSAPCGLALAGTLAIAGMLCGFAGGLIRVHAR